MAAPEAAIQIALVGAPERVNYARGCEQMDGRVKPGHDD
jgi:hypothetical protein